MARGIAAFALLLLIQAGGSVTAQSPFAALWWRAPFLWGFLALLAAFAAASVKGKGLVWMAKALAVLILAGMSLWPFAVPSAVPENFGTPWLWAMINVGAAMCAYGAGARAGCVYAVVIGAVFVCVRTTPQGGGAPLLVALEDAVFATVLGLIICVSIGILRHAAENADAAAEDAIRRYREAAEATALSNERLRLDGLLHDSVMTALLTAARAGSPEERSASAGLARSALQRLDQQGTGHSEAAPATLTEVAARIRFAVDGGTGLLEVTVTCDAPGHLLLPADVVRAVVEAASEAVSNSRRHSGAGRCDVHLAARRTGRTARVAVTVRDSGNGFDPRLVPDRRLGIRVSIVGRMEAVGGSATITSAPGAGTEVLLEWEGDAA
jgi:signal transduction histidine kinase